MNTENIVMCVVALLLGMLLANMLKNVCGCKVVEGLGCTDAPPFRDDQGTYVGERSEDLSRQYGECETPGSRYIWVGGESGDDNDGEWKWTTTTDGYSADEWADEWKSPDTDKNILKNICQRDLKCGYGLVDTKQFDTNRAAHQEWLRSRASGLKSTTSPEECRAEGMPCDGRGDCVVEHTGGSCIPRPAGSPCMASDTDGNCIPRPAGTDRYDYVFASKH
jgi:hypothetical protein